MPVKIIAETMNLFRFNQKEIKSPTKTIRKRNSCCPKLKLFQKISSPIKGRAISIFETPSPKMFKRKDNDIFGTAQVGYAPRITNTSFVDPNAAFQKKM